MMTHLAILLEAPRPGFVKAKLAAEVGEQHALRVYRVLAARALHAIEAAGFPSLVWYTPPEARLEMERWIGPAWNLRPQASGDLGARLGAAARAVVEGVRWIWVGADCPDLTATMLNEAAQVLERTGVVLGPTVEGGYYLLGGWPPLPDLFSEMPWGTAQLLERTRERLIRLGVPWEELLPLRSVDTRRDAKATGLLT